MANSLAQNTGRRLLREVEDESGSLEELLDTLRSGFPSRASPATLTRHLGTWQQRQQLSGPSSAAAAHNIIVRTLHDAQNVVLVVDMSGRLSTQFIASLGADAQARLYVSTPDHVADVAGAVVQLQNGLLASEVSGANAGRVLACTVVMGANMGGVGASGAATTSGATTSITINSGRGAARSCGARGVCGEIWVNGRGSAGVRIERGAVTLFPGGISAVEAVGSREGRAEGMRRAGIVGSKGGGKWWRIEGG